MGQAVTDTHLDDFLRPLAAIEAGGERCQPCEGTGVIRTERRRSDGRVWKIESSGCPHCPKQSGRLAPPDLIAHCLVLADWLEERGDVREAFVRPIPTDTDGTLRGKPSVWMPGQRPLFWQWRWLPDPKRNDFGFDGTHMSKAEAARRLLLLFRRTCERCKGDGKLFIAVGDGSRGCPDCQGIGHFPQTLVREGSDVDTPVQCPCAGGPIKAKVSPDGEHHAFCGQNRQQPTPNGWSVAHSTAKQWAQRHLVSVPAAAWPEGGSR